MLEQMHKVKQMPKMNEMELKSNMETLGKQYMHGYLYLEWKKWNRLSFKEYCALVYQYNLEKEMVNDIMFFSFEMQFDLFKNCVQLEMDSGWQHALLEFYVYLQKVVVKMQPWCKNDLHRLVMEYKENSPYCLKMKNNVEVENGIKWKVPNDYFENAVERENKCYHSMYCKKITITMEDGVAFVRFVEKYVHNIKCCCSEDDMAMAKCEDECENIMYMPTGEDNMEYGHQLNDFMDGLLEITQSANPLGSEQFKRLNVKLSEITQMEELGVVILHMFDQSTQLGMLLGDYVQQGFQTVFNRITVDANHLVLGVAQHIVWCPTFGLQLCLKEAIVSNASQVFFATLLCKFPILVVYRSPVAIASGYKSDFILHLHGLCQMTNHIWSTCISFLHKLVMNGCLITTFGSVLHVAILPELRKHDGEVHQILLSIIEIIQLPDMHQMISHQQYVAISNETIQSVEFYIGQRNFVAMHQVIALIHSIVACNPYLSMQDNAPIAKHVSSTKNHFITQLFTMRAAHVHWNMIFCDNQVANMHEAACQINDLIQMTNDNWKSNIASCGLLDIIRASFVYPDAIRILADWQNAMIQKCKSDTHEMHTLEVMLLKLCSISLSEFAEDSFSNFLVQVIQPFLNNFEPLPMLTIGGITEDKIDFPQDASMQKFRFVARALIEQANTFTTISSVRLFVHEINAIAKTTSKHRIYYLTFCFRTICVTMNTILETPCHKILSVQALRILQLLLDEESVHLHRSSLQACVYQSVAIIKDEEYQSTLLAVISKR